jgi:hypothetical protein
MATKPLVDWLSVEITQGRVDAGGFGETAFFAVSNTGEWTEAYSNTTGDLGRPPIIESGQLTRFELRILDRLADRINQEAIPQPPTLVTPVPPPDDLALSVWNHEGREAVQYSLLRSFDENTGSDPGTYVAYDDPADIEEIAALGAVMGYLERKYGSHDFDFMV